MSMERRYGHYQIAIQLDAAGDQVGIEQHRLHAQLVSETVRLVDQSPLSVIWAFASSRAARHVLARLPNHHHHQLALLGTSAWAGPTVPHQEQIRFVESFFSEAAESGWRVNAFVAADTNVHPDYAYLASHGVDLFRLAPKNGEISMAMKEPPGPRGDGWEIAPTCRFPVTTGWVARFDPAFAAKKALRRAMAKKSTEHLSLSIAEMMRMKNPQQAIQSLASLLQFAAGLQARRRVQSETMETAVKRWQPFQSQPRQRSVLRPAA